MFRYLCTMSLLVLLAVASSMSGQPGKNKKNRPPLPIKTIEVVPADNDLQKLLKARFNKRLEIWISVDRGLTPEIDFPQAVLDLMRATLDLDIRSEDKLAKLKEISRVAVDFDARMQLNVGEDETRRLRSSAAVLDLQLEILKLTKVIAKKGK